MGYPSEVELSENGAKMDSPYLSRLDPACLDEHGQWPRPLAVYFDFGQLDSRGRTIGAFIRRGEAVYIARQDDTDPWQSLLAPGRYFTVQWHAARAGVTFGASQRTQWFTTEAEREAAVMEYLESARKRAMGRT